LILNTLASYYIECARDINGTGKTYQTVSGDRSSDELLAEATQLLNKADQIDHLDAMTLIGKGGIHFLHGIMCESQGFAGNLMLLKGQNDQALYTFNGALQKDPNSIAALIGLVMH
jgi:tetratricopeptide (TPR) repeat protein